MEQSDSDDKDKDSPKQIIKGMRTVTLYKEVPYVNYAGIILRITGMHK